MDINETNDNDGREYWREKKYAKNWRVKKIVKKLCEFASFGWLENEVMQ